LRGNSGGDDPVTVKSVKPDPVESDGSGGPVLRCRVCRSKVTELSARIVVNGQHLHTFFNPHGLVFDIGCFSSASGCAVAGSPSSEFTWFAGHVWRVAVCQQCLAHLGWRFESESGGQGFWGLITDMLLEDSEQGEG
jgi:hypothetical protein